MLLSRQEVMEGEAARMSRNWKSTVLKSANDVMDVLLELQVSDWLCRGQSREYESLSPSIDRGKLAGLPRREKLQLERQSIDVFRSTSRFFAGEDERRATGSDPLALMVLRHYGVPTRLLDWSRSSHIAAYFAVSADDDCDGEIWGFDQATYAEKGKDQWMRWKETTIDNSGDRDKFDYTLKTAFALDDPHDWFVCLFYPQGFPRQNAQNALYSLTARFDRCHARMIRNLLGEDSKCHRYIIKRCAKSAVQSILRERHGVWRGSLYPDSAGAAETASTVFRKSG